MKAKKYRTSYLISDSKYSSHVIAISRRQASLMVEARNLDEVIEGVDPEAEVVYDFAQYSNLRDDEFISKLPEVLHTACYLAFIALKAKTMSIESVIGDEGVVHELAHLLSDVPNKSPLEVVKKKLRDLEDAAVGVYY